MRLLSITAFFFSFTVLTPNSFAATAPLQEYVIVENQIDNEFFIVANRVDPRFSGSNVFTKYQRNSQLSLGYMGYTGTPFSSAYNMGDIWLENSPVNQPFIGNRCMTNNRNCPATSYWPAQQLRDNGAYKIQQTGTPGESGYSRPIFSEAFYRWLAEIPPGTEYTFDLRTCTSRDDYDLSNTTCMTSGGRTSTQQHYIPTNKKGNIILKGTGALQEVFVDSNGNPTIGLGSNFCSTGIVGNASGVICKLVELETKGSSISGSFTVRMYIDSAKLGLARAPAAAQIQYKGSNSTRWTNWSSTTNMSEIFNNGSQNIEVFLSNAYLKSIVDASPNSTVTLADSVYTFGFQSPLPQSGFYEFTPSNYLIIKPRDYGISIIPADFNPNQSKTGKVGSEEPPIEFNYIVTTSGPRQADSITAKVEGPQTTLKGQSYCLFTSNDNKLNVPFSAYLSFKNGSGVKESYRASCDSNEISLKNALWAETPWDRPNEDLGSFYRTNLDLSFPMNDANSFFTLDGIDWLGTVSASGTITVKAIWTGPDIQ
ncbi:fimbrial protein [Providencia rettgeri]|uniref:fimbrial protein n=1 Tax=Providencia rettgeri TaxID=587 RepID=UPI0023AAB087|nr:fimbrial protein [Providencia rettgeri]